MKRNIELRQLFHNENFAVGLGCGNCPEFEQCGGEYTPGLFDCMSKCCNSPSECDYICKKDIESFIAYFSSVQGFDFADVDRLAPLHFPLLPYCIPLINNFSSRTELLDVPAAAIQLRFLFNHTTGNIKFQSKNELTTHFGISPNAKIVITGVSGDGPLEDYWCLGHNFDLSTQLSKLDLDLVTSPNFSVFLDSPRFDNLYNMKRIVLAWNKLYSRGIPTALHLNARTSRDWDRWTEFVYSRAEVSSISFEFGTGAGVSERGEWHTKKLSELALNVGRPLQLVVRGGYKHLPDLYRAFPNLVFIDTASFIKSVKRKALTKTPTGSPKWVSVASPEMKNLDDLMIDNIDKYSNLIAKKLSSRSLE